MNQEEPRTMDIIRLTGNRARVRRYRTTPRRFDYIPSPDVPPIIQHHLKIETDRCMAGVIDYLVRSGRKKTSRIRIGHLSAWCILNATKKAEGCQTQGVPANAVSASATPTVAQDADRPLGHAGLPENVHPFHHCCNQPSNILSLRSVFLGRY